MEVTGRSILKSSPEHDRPKLHAFYLFSIACKHGLSSSQNTYYEVVLTVNHSMTNEDITIRVTSVGARGKKLINRYEFWGVKRSIDMNFGL